MVDGGGCEREASGGEYPSRCAPCGVMHACIGDRAATGEAARYRCVRVVLVLFVACATVAPCHSRMAMYTLDIWTCCDYHTRRPISLRGRMAIWSSLENVASVLSIDTLPRRAGCNCRVQRAPSPLPGPWSGPCLPASKLYPRGVQVPAFQTFRGHQRASRRQVQGVVQAPIQLLHGGVQLTAYTYGIAKRDSTHRPLSLWCA